MDGWADGWTDGSVDGWVDGRVDGWVGGRTDDTLNGACRETANFSSRCPDLESQEVPRPGAWSISTFPDLEPGASARSCLLQFRLASWWTLDLPESPQGAGRRSLAWLEG